MKIANTKKKIVKKRFIVESIAILFIVISPFVFKLHEFLPRDPDATIRFWGMVFDKNGFADLNTYAWFLLGKMVPLFLLFIWFLTCKQWWYHIILIPLMMYAFQIFEVFYSNDKFIDTRNLLWLLPVCMVVIPFVYFIRIKLYDKYVHGIDLEAMEAELRMLKEKQGISKKKPEPAFPETSNEIDYKSFSEEIDERLSTNHLWTQFKQFQTRMGNWLDFKF
ncbi:MAG TPA: hypothetical protein VFM69_00080 [Pricia sp.]|nr:hypothetical protein [Pricia sp.]